MKGPNTEHRTSNIEGKEARRGMTAKRRMQANPQSQFRNPIIVPEPVGEEKMRLSLPGCQREGQREKARVFSGPFPLYSHRPRRSSCSPAELYPPGLQKDSSMGQHAGQAIAEGCSHPVAALPAGSQQSAKRQGVSCRTVGRRTDPQALGR